MKTTNQTRTLKKGLALALSGLSLLASAQEAPSHILNASYDVGRELYAAINEAFVPHYKETTGRDIEVRQSHAGSSRQARAILEGLQADVVTFNQVTDVNVLAADGLVDADWTEAYPHNSSPFYSVHAILVRKGNPKGIRDWADLAKPGVSIVQVNPKTGGNGRYAALAYYIAGLESGEGDEGKAREFTKSILRNVVAFEQGGRAATAAFTERNIGDALVTFESEALWLASGENSPYEVITPSVSALSEFPVAVVKSVAAARNSTPVAEAYLSYLYTPAAQRIIADSFYRPRDEAVAKAMEDTFPPVKAVEPAEHFGGWDKITETFFANNALIDQLLAEIARAGRR